MRAGVRARLTERHLAASCSWLPKRNSRWTHRFFDAPRERERDRARERETRRERGREREGQRERSRERDRERGRERDRKDRDVRDGGDWDERSPPAKRARVAERSRSPPRGTHADDLEVQFVPLIVSRSRLARLCVLIRQK